MFGMSGGELVVLGLVALFVLGPERLPGAIRTVAAALSQGRAWLEEAKGQLDSPELRGLREPLEELRAPLADLRAADPRNAVRDLFADRPARDRTPAAEESGPRPDSAVG